MRHWRRNLPSQLLSNGSEFCGEAYGVLDLGDNQTCFTDVGHKQVKFLSFTRSNEQEPVKVSHVTKMAGSGNAGTRDGSNAEFSQPIGICAEGKTIFVADTAIERLHMVTNPTELLKFLGTLNNFAKAFSFHLKKEKKVTIFRKILRYPK
jgi:hypothetical protein